MSPKQREILDNIIRSAATEIADKVGVVVHLKVARFERISSQLDKVLDLFGRICKVWGVEMDDLKTKSRKTDPCIMRQVLWFAAKANYPMVTLKEIGGILGRPDHSIVIQQIEKAMGLIKVDDAQFMRYFQPVKHLIYAE